MPTPSPASRAPSRTRVALLFWLLCLLWGSTWVVIKQGLDDLPPLTSAAARFVVAAIAMAAAVPFLRAREGGTAPPIWLTLVLGVLNFAVSYAVVYRTEQVLPSGLTSVLWAVYPLLMAAAGHWFLGERLRRLQALGFGVGFLGVALLFRTDLLRLGPGAAPGAALLFVSPLVSAIGTTVLKRFGSECSSMLLNRNAMALGAALLVLAAWLFESGAHADWTAAAIGSVAWLAVMGTCLTFGLWFWLLRWAPASQLSLIAFVTPCIALWLGWFVRDEPVGASTLLGTGLIFAGIALARRRRTG
jgi:drug/metabolite transporter (DMT)-like permease